MTLSKAEAGGGGGPWWGRLRWMYCEADLIYDWSEGGKFIYTDCRCELASVRLSLMSEKATMKECGVRCMLYVVCRVGVGFASQLCCCHPNPFFQSKFFRL